MNVPNRDNLTPRLTSSGFVYPYGVLETLTDPDTKLPYVDFSYGKAVTGAILAEPIGTFFLVFFYLT
jgi:hypothetical protein